MPMMVNADSVGRREAEAGPLVYLAESIFHHSTTCPHSEPQPAKKTKKKLLASLKTQIGLLASLSTTRAR